MLLSQVCPLSALLLTLQVVVFCAVTTGSTLSIAGKSEPSSKLCIPFSKADVASANLTEAEQSILPELCYQPDLAPHLFGTEDDRGIPPGVQCTPVQWYMRTCRPAAMKASPGTERKCYTYLAGVTVTNTAPQCANVGV